MLNSVLHSNSLLSPQFILRTSRIFKFFHTLPIPCHILKLFLKVSKYGICFAVVLWTTQDSTSVFSIVCSTEALGRCEGLAIHVSS